MSKTTPLRVGSGGCAVLVLLLELVVAMAWVMVRHVLEAIIQSRVAVAVNARRVRILDSLDVLVLVDYRTKSQSIEGPALRCRLVRFVPFRPVPFYTTVLYCIRWSPKRCSSLDR